jgi:2,3-bisphosphoglycerate-independent phosphoglycerate mutase
VLRIAKLGAGGERYYLQSVGLEPRGVWLGRGPEAMGLGVEVEGEILRALMAGHDPGSGEVLGSARGRVRVHGFDLTFAAPNVT